MSIRFYLPEFYYKYELNMALINLLKQHPEYFIDNLKIGAVYGTFPGAIWNGGRVFLKTIADLENIQATINAFNDLKIPVRYTFTNCLLESKHCYDTYCNIIMEESNNGMNEILVNSECLENYLKKEYPNFKYIQSTTRCQRNLELINKASEEYFLTVIDYRDNVNKDFLSSLNNKNKIEILVNPYCNPNCSRRCEHYKDLSKQQLTYSCMPSIDCIDMCNSFYDALEKYPTTLTNQDICSLIDLGFKHFKIEGRTNHNVDVIESYVYYMVKPEYKDKVRCLLLKAAWH